MRGYVEALEALEYYGVENPDHDEIMGQLEADIEAEEAEEPE
jgi:hypothetical protein